MKSQLPSFDYLSSVLIEGYRPFKDFRAEFGTLTVLVGANGTGKSSLFEFLRFLRDGSREDIPPEIVAGGAGQDVFHRPGPDRIHWMVTIQRPQLVIVDYYGEIQGPKGQTQVLSERVRFEGALALSQRRRWPKDFDPSLGSPDEQVKLLMNVHDRSGLVREPATGDVKRQEIKLRRPTQLALSSMTNPALAILYNLREFISSWRFYNSFNISNDRIRRSAPVEQNPVLHEDGGNISAVLFYLMTEHPDTFDELKAHIRLAIPGFRNLNVKARGGPGEVIGFWQEEGVDSELSLADLSDGILRFLCWTVLCLTPTPPPVICLDEPDQGVHPRTLPILAGLLQKASYHTQVLVATHSSYFLSQFDIGCVGVIRKIGGESKYLKPADSAALRANLADFGAGELEAMHRSDELEVLSRETPNE